MFRGLFPTTNFLYPHPEKSLLYGMPFPLNRQKFCWHLHVRNISTLKVTPDLQRPQTLFYERSDASQSPFAN